MRKKIVVLTGAGISAESGIPTFRGNGGLWEGHDIMEVASPQGWQKNPELVLSFYNERRKFAQNCQPNAAHLALTLLEEKYDVQIVTQNVDDLHERADNANVLHLHGMLNLVRSINNESLISTWMGDLKMGDAAIDQYQLRPHIVWFGESVPMLMPASEYFIKADIVLIIGTSLQVYPAAGLTDFCSHDTHIYYIDPNPSAPTKLRDSKHLRIIASKASTAVPQLVKKLLAEF